jgi:DNA (cytosine-5)-methyltransferase 1
MGYHYAGFDVIGVDPQPQPRYPFPVLHDDGLALLNDAELLSEIDAVHAGPPLTLLGRTLRAVQRLSIPWVVESVEAATMPASVVLCGTHFNLAAGPRVLRRHRRFSAGFALHDPGPCFCRDRPALTAFTSAQARTATGIDWMDGLGLRAAVPPDYTRWVAEQLMDRLARPVNARDHLRERYSSARIERFAKL